MSKKNPGLRLVEKRVDETHYLTGERRGGVLREEVWYSGEEVVKYALAYIDPHICGVDNGRVIGYDNSHNHHHKHFMGVISPHIYTSYAELYVKYMAEVRNLWRQHAGQNDNKSR